ncbi:hypothetical protein D3C78_20450 [compost metagenome]
MNILETSIEVRKIGDVFALVSSIGGYHMHTIGPASWVGDALSKVLDSSKDDLPQDVQGILNVAEKVYITDDVAVIRSKKTQRVAAYLNPESSLSNGQLVEAARRLGYKLTLSRGSETALFADSVRKELVVLLKIKPDPKVFLANMNGSLIYLDNGELYVIYVDETLGILKTRCDDHPIYNIDSHMLVWNKYNLVVPVRNEYKLVSDETNELVFKSEYRGQGTKVIIKNSHYIETPYIDARAMAIAEAQYNTLVLPVELPENKLNHLPIYHGQKLFIDGNLHWVLINDMWINVLPQWIEVFAPQDIKDEFLVAKMPI